MPSHQIVPVRPAASAVEPVTCHSAVPAPSGPYRSRAQRSARQARTIMTAGLACVVIGGLALVPVILSESDLPARLGVEIPARAAATAAPIGLNVLLVGIALTGIGYGRRYPPRVRPLGPPTESPSANATGAPEQDPAMPVGPAPTRRSNTGMRQDRRFLDHLAAYGIIIDLTDTEERAVAVALGRSISTSTAHGTGITHTHQSLVDRGFSSDQASVLVAVALACYPWPSTS